MSTLQKKRAERFIEQAEKGTSLALAAIGRLERLADPGKYVYTAEQVEALTGALKAQVQRLEQRFSAGQEATAKFSFK